jgi:2,3-dihydro-2,3-dihydroxybenzoate dehydrogenase
MGSGNALKVALVTGAGGGIGAQVVERLLHSSYKVYGIDRCYPLEAHKRESFVAIEADVSSLEECEKALSLIDAPIDILANVAAVRPLSPFLDTALDDWEDCLKINLTGPFMLMQLAVPRMPRGGSILNISSAAAFGKKNLAAYGASKAGLISLTKTAALELADRGIRVNAALPGTTATPMLGQDEHPEQPKKAQRNIGGHVLKPGTIAEAIIAIAENPSISGAVIPLGLLPAEW